MNTSRTLAAVVGLGVAFAGAPLMASQASAADDAAPLRTVAGAKVDSSYIVILKETSGMNAAEATVSAASRAKGLGAKVTHEYKAIRGYAATMNAQQLEKVRQDPAVAYVEENGIMRATAEQTGATWGIDRSDQRSLPLNSRYVYNNTGQGVKAYIVDTGVNSSHQEFSGRMAQGFSAVNDGKGTNDCNGHGTHVAGTTAGTTYGIAKRATVVPVRVLGCDGSGSNAGVIQGMDWVAQNATRPAVANMSLGGGASQSTDDAVARMTAKGITVAVAAGNDNDDACRYSPARAASAITVASSTRNDSRSSFSNYGSCTDIFAPGSDITSAWINSSTATNTISGTSMASPHVAGAAALVLQSNPSWSPAQVTAELNNDSTKNVISDPKGSPNRLMYTDPQGGGTPGPTPTPTTTAPEPTPTTTAPQPGGGIKNGDFEQGPTVGWTGDTGTINTAAYPAASGQYKAHLAGYGRSATEAIAQQVTVGGQGILRFKLRVDSAETTRTTAYDRMTVRVLVNGSARTVATFSNLNESAGYVSKAYDLSSLAGQNVQLQFSATEDTSAQTSFLIDDVSLG